MYAINDYIYKIIIPYKLISNFEINTYRIMTIFLKNRIFFLICSYLLLRKIIVLLYRKFESTRIRIYLTTLMCFSKFYLHELYDQNFSNAWCYLNFIRILITISIVNRSIHVNIQFCKQQDSYYMTEFPNNVFFIRRIHVKYSKLDQLNSNLLIIY